LDALEQFLVFTERLTAAKMKIQYRLDRQREAIMVAIVTPQAYYEVEFLSTATSTSRHSLPVRSTQ